MAGDQAQKKRAARLRERIHEATDTPAPPLDPSKQQPGESPHEYVERRMRELDKKAEKGRLRPVR